MWRRRVQICTGERALMLRLEGGCKVPLAVVMPPLARPPRPAHAPDAFLSLRPRLVANGIAERCQWQPARYAESAWLSLGHSRSTPSLVLRANGLSFGTGETPVSTGAGQRGMHVHRTRTSEPASRRRRRWINRTNESAQATEPLGGEPERIRITAEECGSAQSPQACRKYPSDACQ